MSEKLTIANIFIVSNFEVMPDSFVVNVISNEVTNSLQK
jgi:hypothetical protein